jgi:pimeloyl-ACP methyl ester carboxylesterase
MAARRRGGLMTGAVSSADGVTVRYDVHGRGLPALVLVHGWSCDRGHWRHQVPYFAAERTVVAVDLAGHGESGTAGRNAWTMPSFGDDVAAVVDRLGLRDLVLAGHSMGGDVIIEAARGLPGRVRGLIWLDTYRRPAEPGDPGQAAADLTAFLAPFTCCARRDCWRPAAAAASRWRAPRSAGPCSAGPGICWTSPVITATAVRSSSRSSEASPDTPAAPVARNRCAGRYRLRFLRDRPAQACPLPEPPGGSHAC